MPITTKMEQGILLYYKYVDLSVEQEQVHQLMLSLCRDLDLRGRVRVAIDGINCTVNSLGTCCSKPAIANLIL